MTGLLLFILAAGFIANLLGLSSMTINSNIYAGRFSGSENATVTGEAAVEANPTVAAAVVGTLTTRTNSTSGTLTMSTGHGLTTGQRVDLYWADGHCYGAILGTVATNSVPIASVEGGDALPIASTVITVGPCNAATFVVTGSNVQGLLLVSGGPTGYIVLHDGTDDQLAAYVAPAAGYSWRTGTITNPVAGDALTTVYMSQRVTTGSSTDMGAVAIVA